MSSVTGKRVDKDNALESPGKEEPLQEDANENQVFVEKNYSILYKCKYCEMSYSDERGIYPHLQTHSGSKVYGCAYCQKSFTNVNDLLLHFQDHKGENLKCSTCSATFKHLINLSKHLERHDYDKLYQCQKCDYFSYSLAVMKTHLKRPHERIFKCEACGITFRFWSRLKKHIRNRCQDKEFNCTSCNRKFVTYESLKTHIDSKNGCENPTEVVPTNLSSARCSSEVEKFSRSVKSSGQVTSSTSKPEISCSPVTSECSRNVLKNVPRRRQTSETRPTPGKNEVPEILSSTATISGNETELESRPVEDSPKFLETHANDDISPLKVSPSLSDFLDDSAIGPQSAPSLLDDLDGLSLTELSSAAWAHSPLELYLETLQDESSSPPHFASFPDK